MNEFDFIDTMPGFVSVIDLNLKYIAVNQNLSFLINSETEIIGKIAGESCQAQTFQMQQLLNSPIGTRITWEYCYKNKSLEVSSTRIEGFIFNQAVDVTERKLLEQQVKFLSHNNDNLPPKIINVRPESIFATSLTENPIVNPQLKETLMRMEIQIQQNSSLLQRIEQLIFFNENSLSIRIKALEIEHKNDRLNWQEIVNNKAEIKDLTRNLKFITGIPGGIKSWIIILVLTQMLGIFVIDLGVRMLDLNAIVEYFIKKEFLDY
jgi:hypothetical protein